METREEGTEAKEGTDFTKEGVFNINNLTSNRLGNKSTMPTEQGNLWVISESKKNSLSRR